MTFNHRLFVIAASTCAVIGYPLLGLDIDGTSAVGAPIVEKQKSSDSRSKTEPGNIVSIEPTGGSVPLTVRIVGPKVVKDAIANGTRVFDKPSAKIQWGDGYRSPMVRPPFPAEEFGSHTYTVPGHYAVTVTVSSGGGDVQIPVWSGTSHITVGGKSSISPSVKITRIVVGAFPHAEWQMQTDRKVDLHAQFIDADGKFVGGEILKGIANNYPTSGRTFKPEPIEVFYNKTMKSGRKKFKLRLLMKDNNSGKEVCSCETDYFFMSASDKQSTQ